LALKYAFPDGTPGKVEISCQPDGDMLKLSIEDDGAGTSSDSGAGLGRELVHTMALQNGGTIERKTSKGVRWEVRLPLVKLETAGQLRAAM
jgi:two-component sensor histidine kinase